MTTRWRRDEPVSVIVPVFDRVAMLAEGVASVLVQEHPLEVIIIDDGSTDGTSELADELEARDPRVRVVHQSNGGPGAARNAGLRMAIHRLVANHDSDDLMLPDRLTRQVACLVDRPDACAVVSMAQTERVAGTETASHVLRRFGRLERGALCTLLVDRDLALAVGGYTETLRLGEDTELLLKLREAGHEYVHHREVVTRRRFHDDNLVATDIAPGSTLLGLVHRHLTRVRVEEPRDE